MSALLRRAKSRVGAWLADARVSAAARGEMRLDARGVPELDPGAERVVAEGIAWLGRAQDHSRSQDGGVARDYSLLTGWNASYPETTGYIVPTLLDEAALTGNEECRQRARRMLDWLVAIQLPGGGFQGGVIGATPVVPVTFNTGQILLGLAAGQVAFGSYAEATIRAADWLVETQDADGCWRRHPSPFTHSGEKTYETHVAWGLLEAARATGRAAYGDAAVANIAWAIEWQRPNGWFDRCCLTDPLHPLTHTLGYVLRGVIEGYRFSQKEVFLAAAIKAADGLLRALGPEGRLPGRLDAEWRAAVPWVCLTGISQIAHCWLQLYEITGDAKYRNAARRANSYVRRTVKVEGADEMRGAVKGSFPTNGDYGRFEFLNWACKFTIDANRLEMKLS